MLSKRWYMEMERIKIHSVVFEMADPVVSPGYTEGRGGTPNEVKIKMIADKISKTFQAKS